MPSAAETPTYEELRVVHSHSPLKGCIQIIGKSRSLPEAACCRQLQVCSVIRLQQPAHTPERSSVRSRCVLLFPFSPSELLGHNVQDC